MPPKSASVTMPSPSESMFDNDREADDFELVCSQSLPLLRCRHCQNPCLIMIGKLMISS
jgi:hypothetical protein